MQRVISTGLIVTLLSSWGLAADDKVELKVEFPEEVLAGTPPEVLILLFPGLVAPSEEMPKFMVPKGTTNVALKKKVTSSDSNPILGELAFITDGKKTGSEESFVELAPMKQWVQIDLGKPHAIYAAWVWHYFREARSYHDIILQVSDDPKFEKGVKTVYSNDQDNSAKMGIGKRRPYIDTNLGWMLDAKGAKGRFVRLYSNGNTANDLNHYVEVELFGKPVK
jgi:hypothetical protein